MEKKALTYTLEIERHEDGYLAYFPALPGCHTWAKTYEAAVRYAEEVDRCVGLAGRHYQDGRHRRSMLARLPGARAREVVKALERGGFLFDHQQGSHAFYGTH